MFFGTRIIKGSEPIGNGSDEFHSFKKSEPESNLGDLAGKLGLKDEGLKNVAGGRELRYENKESRKEIEVKSVEKKKPETALEQLNAIRKKKTEESRVKKSDFLTQVIDEKGGFKNAEKKIDSKFVREFNSARNIDQHPLGKLMKEIAGHNKFRQKDLFEKVSQDFSGKREIKVSDVVELLVRLSDPKENKNFKLAQKALEEYGISENDLKKAQQKIEREQKKEEERQAKNEKKEAEKLAKTENKEFEEFMRNQELNARKGVLIEQRKGEAFGFLRGVGKHVGEVEQKGLNTFVAKNKGPKGLGNYASTRLKRAGF